MAIKTQRTRVMLDGEDISALVARCNLLRFPGEEQTVELTVFIDRLEIDDETLVIHIEPPRSH
jgi:hypothetical protein